RRLVAERRAPSVEEQARHGAEAGGLGGLVELLAHRVRQALERPGQRLCGHEVRGAALVGRALLQGGQRANRVGGRHALQGLEEHGLAHRGLGERRETPDQPRRGIHPVSIAGRRSVVIVTQRVLGYDSTSTMAETRVIKRYANRKLYDT